MLDFAKYIIFFFFILTIWGVTPGFAQMPLCAPDAPVYIIQNNNEIFSWDPAQPLVNNSNPSLFATAPAGATGLAVGPNLNASSPATTFYTTLNGKYYYYSGSTWVNTGHNAGSNDAINPGAGGGYIFNVDVLTGIVWRYDGTSDAVQIATVQMSGCIYDLAVDCAGNFYILRTTSPQRMLKYNSAGVLLTSYSVTGVIPIGGAGLAVMGNHVYYTDYSYMHGIINGNSINFEVLSNPTDVPTGTDMASCSGTRVYATPDSVTICERDLPFNWHSQNYSLTGTYQQALPGIGGCDSIITLELTINPNITGNHQDKTVCSSSLPYFWQGQHYNLPGNYTVTLTSNHSCDSIVSLALHVTPVPDLPMVQSYIYYCQHDAASELAAFGSGALLWYTTATGGIGSTVAPLPATNLPGVIHYFVAQQTAGCESGRKEVIVQVYNSDIFHGDKQVTICQQQSLDLTTLYVTNGFLVTWQNNGVEVPEPSNVTSAGFYQAYAISSDGCRDTATITINVLPAVLASAGNDIIVESNHPFHLYGTGGVIYDWSPSVPLNNAHLQSPTAILSENTTFYLMVKDAAGCSAFDSINIKVVDGPAIYLPTAFSPNNDGLNDVFGGKAFGIESLYYFRIYNRYGELLFQTTDVAKGWDGTFKGIKQVAGNYTWLLRAQTRTGKMLNMKGNVLLLR